MRRNLITATTAAALFLGSTALPMTSVQAATTATPPAAKSGSLEKVKAAVSQLNLSSSQQEKVKSILESAKGKKKACKGENPTGTSAASKQKSHSAAKGVIQQIAAVLTPVQKTKFMELVKGEKA